MSTIYPTYQPIPPQGPMMPVGGAMPATAPMAPHSAHPMPGYPAGAYPVPFMSSPVMNPLVPPGAVSTPGGPLAQSFGMGPFPQLIPPDQLAPCVFNQHLHTAPSQPPSSNPSPGYYNYNNFAPNYPGYPVYPGYPPQQPYPAVQPLPPAAEKPAEKPATPPAAEKPAEKPADKPVEKPADLPKSIRGEMTLTATAVREMNTDLSSNDSSTRMLAATRLHWLLNNNPNILSQPEYKDFAEALILKTLRDSDSVVRYPVLVSMQMGNVNQPTPAILARLKELSKDNGMYGFERSDIKKVLDHYTDQNQQQAAEAKAVEAKPAPSFPPGVLSPAAMMPQGMPGAQPMGLPPGMDPRMSMPQGMPGSQPLGLPPGMDPRMSMPPGMPGNQPMGVPPGMDPRMGNPAAMPMFPQMGPPQGGMPPQGAMGMPPGRPLFPQRPLLHPSMQAPNGPMMPGPHVQPGQRLNRVAG